MKPEEKQKVQAFGRNVVACLGLMVASLCVGLSSCLFGTGVGFPIGIVC